MDKIIRLIFFHRTSNLFERNKAIMRFVIVGGINTSIDFLTFMLFSGLLGVDKFISQILAYGMGMVNSFILNKLWTFQNKNSACSTLYQVRRFTTINIISLGVSLLCLKLMKDNHGVNIYVSKIFATILAQAVNYFGYKLWVFKKGVVLNEEL